MTTHSPENDATESPAAATSAPPSPDPTGSVVDAIDSRVAALEGELHAAREKIRESEARRHIQRLLMEAQTIDVDACTLLAEAALKQGASALEKLGDRAIARVVDDLRRQKPALFRSAPRARASAMGGVFERPESPIAGAAEEAARTGSRTDLLRYLRLRRARRQEASV